MFMYFCIGIVFMRFFRLSLQHISWLYHIMRIMWYMEVEYMTIKKAVETFKIDEKIIRKSIKDGMIPKRKVGRNIEIPDETDFIPVKNDIQAFLFQILCYKNNSRLPVSRRMCPDAESLKILFEYLYRKGYITEYEFSEDVLVLFNNIVLTDEAIDLIFSKYKMNQLKNINFMPISLNPTLKIGLNVG